MSSATTTPGRLWPNPDPKKTALLVIDMQNDFLSDEGWYARKGIDISHMQKIIPHLKKLIAVMRRLNVPIIYTRHMFRDVKDGGILVSVRPILKDGGLRCGTWGVEIIDELKPRPEDWIVQKSRLSAFFSTNLDLILRGLKVDTVILTGILTNQCVESTSREASFRDYKVIVISDCVGTIHLDLHEPSLKATRVGWGDVTTSDEIIKDLESSIS